MKFKCKDMRNWIALVIILSISFTACKQDAATKAETQKSEEPKNAVKNNTDTKVLFTNLPGPAISVDKREKAETMLKYRREQDDKKSWAILESGVWKYVFVFNGESMSKPSEEIVKWVDFKQDGTFDYGEGSKVVTAGQYHYNFDKGELLMIDNDVKSGPAAWKVNNVGAAMVLLGQSEFTNNSYQIKLDKMDSRPQ